MAQQLCLRSNYLNPFRRPGQRRPIRPTLDMRHSINGNLRAIIWFGDKVAGEVTNLGPYMGEFTNGANLMTLQGFDVSRLAPTDRGGQALTFGGSGVGVDMARGYFADLGAGPWSVLMRFKETSNFPGDEYVLYEPASGHNDFAFALKSGTGAYQLNIGDNTGLQSASTFATQTWYVVIITYDASNYQVFINGVLDKTAAWSTSPAASTGDTIIGGVTTSSQTFGGIIDHIRFWRRTINTPEAQLLTAEPYAGIDDIRLPIRRGPPLKVTGTVTELGSPVAKLVAAYDTSTLGLIGSTTSDGGTGDYTIPVGTHKDVFVVAFDPTTYQALIYDRVTAVEA